MNTQNNQIDFLARMAKIIPHYEHSKMADYSNYDLSKLVYKHSQLKEKAVAGNVLSSFRDENGELNYIIDKLNHLLIVGSTGSGKSTGPISAQIISSLMSQVISLIVSDPKGDLYRRYASLAIEQGYKVKLIDLTNSEHSEAYGVFYNIACDFRDEYLSIGKGVKQKYIDNELVFEYKNRMFYDKESLNQFYQKEMKRNLTKTQSKVRNIITRLFPIESKKEPHWEKNAYKLILALAMALIMDQFSLNEKLRTTPDKVNISNMKNIFDSFSVKRRGSLDDRGFFSNRGENSFLFTEVKRIFFENHESTMRNYIGFVDDAFTKYNFDAFLDITLTSTLKAEDFINEKTILFIKYDEMNSLCQDFLSFFISSLLADLKKIADDSDGLTLKRPVLFIIDEFASLPKNSDIVNFVAYGRSRNIFIHYVLQDYTQVRSKYKEEADTLINNSGNIMFLGSNDYDTLQEFSKQLGKCTILSPDTICNTSEYQHIAFDERPLVTCSELALLQQGQVFVKRFGNIAVKGIFEKSYECEEYLCEASTVKNYISKLNKLFDLCQYDVSNIVKEVDDDDDEDDLF